MSETGGRDKQECQELMSQAIQILDDSINKAIKTKEKEYLYAYKDHISQVQEDLEKMKNEADDMKELKKLMSTKEIKASEASAIEKGNLLQQKLDSYSILLKDYK